MNDFTKEELESLLAAIGSVRVYTEIKNYEEDLFDKIQFMIARKLKYDIARSVGICNE